MIEDAGAQGLTIHCRTRAQGHRGDPDYAWIPKVKQSVAIPIIVNGGIDTPERAKHVFEVTGCDGVMIARSAIQNPWLFAEIKHFLQTGERLPDPSFSQRLDLLRRHLQLSVQHKGERCGVIEFRKHYSGYLRNHPGVSRLRSERMRYLEIQPIFDHIDNFMESLTTPTAVEAGESLAA